MPRPAQATSKPQCFFPWRFGAYEIGLHGQAISWDCNSSSLEELMAVFLAAPARAPQSSRQFRKRVPARRSADVEFVWNAGLNGVHHTQNLSHRFFERTGFR